MSMLRVWVVWFAALASAACGGSDDEQRPAPRQESTDASADGTAAEGGAVLECGGERCELPQRYVLNDSCCLDAFTGGCGVMLAGTCQRYSKRDARCPAATPDGQMGEAAEESGVIPCCAGNGECGLDVGLGCVATSQACNVYPRAFIEALGSRTCDGEQLELAADCGNDL